MFGFLKEKINKVFSSISSKFGSIFNITKIDESTLSELKKILIEADFGSAFAQQVVSKVEQEAKVGKITDGKDLKLLLRSLLQSYFQDCEYQNDAQIFLLVGINGTGKTTFAAKLANRLKKEGKKVLLVAADTFRAAAVEQLKDWAHKIGVEVVIGKENSDPASIIFTGCQKFKDEAYDILIVDTAGRLQTKSNLMQELSKVKKVISKQLPDKNISTLQTIDSMLGQNSFDQAKVFNEATQMSGVVLTKFDGTGKGGIIFRIISELGVPVAYVSYGESLDSFDKFNKDFYLNKIFE